MVAVGLLHTSCGGFIILIRLCRQGGIIKGNTDTGKGFYSIGRNTVTTEECAALIKKLVIIIIRNGNVIMLPYIFYNVIFVGCSLEQQKY